MAISIKKISFSVLVVFFILCNPLIISAFEESVVLKNEIINPGSFYYPLKRLWEKGLGRLQFSSQSRNTFYESQLKIRLTELRFVVENNLLSEVQTSSERFAYQAGILSEELIKQNNVSGKENLIKEFGAYGKFLAGLRDKYPANSSFWMLVQHDINTLQILSEKLR